MSGHDQMGDPSRPIERDVAERLRTDLLRFFVRRAGDDRLAEDLAQEALLHVVRGLPRYRGAATLGTWARRIALNVWRDHVRHRKGERGRVDVSVDALLDALEPALPAPTPEAAHDRRTTRACLIEATRALPLAARRMLLLHDFGEMPLEQAAAALGCSPATAKVRLHRARRRLGEHCRSDCVCEPGSDGTSSCTPKARRRE
jgi:RNA polymerase sigma-70 factor (ECF subfamily)